MSSELVEHGAHAVETPAAAAAPAAKPNMRLLALLAFGHMVVDINGGLVTALLPFLKTALSLSYKSSAAIILALNVTSSLIQPVFGYFADKTARRWILPSAVFLSALGIGLTGLTSLLSAIMGSPLQTRLSHAPGLPQCYRPGRMLNY